MGGFTIADMTDVIQAGVAVAVALGGGVAFLWGRFAVFRRETRAELTKCEDRAVAHAAQSRERRGTLYTIIEFMGVALHRHDPDAPEIEQSRRMIGELRERDRFEAEQERKP